MNPIPDVGDHNEALLEELGFDEARRDTLHHDGAV
jgi:crotonobetainyl-CoA:carnitine CoA-transferase CaiB-like acyl-CoA transferase